MSWKLCGSFTQVGLALYVLVWLMTKTNDELHGLAVPLTAGALIWLVESLDKAQQARRSSSP